MSVMTCTSSPNEQNSEWGIETGRITTRPRLPNNVRTNRIPNGELKLDYNDSADPVSQGPNEQNSEWGIETVDDFPEVDGGVGPNEQNSEWGIETACGIPGISSPHGVRTNRIPNGELKRR